MLKEELSAKSVEEVSSDDALALVRSTEDGVSVDVIPLVDENSCEVVVAVKGAVVGVDVSNLLLLVSKLLPLDISSLVVDWSEEDSGVDELI